MASDAGTLLAAAHPEEAGFAFERLAVAIDEFNLQRLLSRHLHEERSVGFDGSGAKKFGLPGGIT